MFCPQCGNNLPDDAQFCGYCGASLVTSSVPEKEKESIEPKQTISLEKAETIVPDNSDVKVENYDSVQTTQTADMRAVIGKNADYYLKEFAKIDAGGKASFNIAAFFLVLGFCLYRKCGRDIGKKYLMIPFMLYIISTIFLVIGVIMFSLSIMAIGGLLYGVGSVWLIVSDIRLGLNFNSEYYKHCQRVLQEGRQSAYGTSLKNFIIFYGAVVCLVVVSTLAGSGGLFLNIGLDDDIIDEDISMYLQDEQGKNIYIPNKSNDMSDMDMYQFIMDKYTAALSEHWNVDQLEDNGLNYQLVYYDGNDIGYMLLDINNDGTQELIIGLIGYDYTASILDLYTISDNQLVQIISAGERNRYHLLRNGLIYNEGSSGATESVWSLYEFDAKSTSLKLKESFIYKEELDYYYNADSKKKLINVSEDEFANYWADFEAKLDYNYLDLTVFPFDDSAFWEVALANETTEPDTPYFLMGSDSRYLDESELYGFTADDCRIARNEIYARHGRKFNSADLQDYFNAQGWYVPTIEADAFSDSMLNDYERANINLIVAYEKAQGYR